MNSGRCAACKYLRRRCPPDCIFSPYFPPNNPHRFASVHRIYGASNIGKMLQQLPVHLRGTAAETLYQEAQCRIDNPVYGCVGVITQLHEEIHNAEKELARAEAELAVLRASNILETHHHLQQKQQQVQVQVQGTAPAAINNSSYNSSLPVQNVMDNLPLNSLPVQNVMDNLPLIGPSDSTWFCYK